MIRSVLVTGASSGIGEACALRLDAAGHRVFAGVRKEADGERLAAAASDKLVPVLLDVTDEAQIEGAAKQVEETAGGLHGVVNNAGIALGGPVEYLPLDVWRQQFEVNVFGQIAVTKALLPLLRREQGRIVFVGSISGRVATPLMGPYAASKFAIEAVGEALRHELHPWRLPVVVVEPGAIKTPIWDKGRSTADRLEQELPPEAAERYRAHIDAVRAGIEMQDRQAIAPDAVAAVVERALTVPRPRTRYLVGKDARAQAVLRRALPDRPFEAVIRRFAGP